MKAQTQAPPSTLEDPQSAEKRELHATPAWVLKVCTNWIQTQEAKEFIRQHPSGMFTGSLEQPAVDPIYEEVPCVCPACCAVPKGWYEDGTPRYTDGLHYTRDSKGRVSGYRRCLCAAGSVYGYKGISPEFFEAMKQKHMASGEIRPMTLDDIPHLGRQFAVTESALVREHGRVSQSAELPF